MEVSGQLHVLAILPPEKGLYTHWIGGWVDPSADLYMVKGKGKVVPVLF
jgi:hypothetical protein